MRVPDGVRWRTAPPDQVFHETEPGLSAGLLSTNMQLVAHPVGKLFGIPVGFATWLGLTVA